MLSGLLLAWQVPIVPAAENPFLDHYLNTVPTAASITISTASAGRPPEAPW